MIRRSVLVPALVFALAPVGETSARAQDPRPPRVEREVAESASSRGWLGVAFTSQNGGPVVIDAVFPDSPADRAGVERGDTLLRVNGEVARNDALRARRFSPGDTVRMELRRGGRERQVRVIAERRGRETIVLRTGDREHGVDMEELREVMAVQVDSIGVHLDSLFTRLDSTRVRVLRTAPGRIREMRLDSLLERRLPETLPFSIELGSRALAGAEFTQLNPGLGRYFGTEEGLLALRVAPGSPAARAGLEAGDVVVRAGSDKVVTVRDLRQAVARAPEDSTRLEVIRQRQRREVTLRWDRSEVRRGTEVTRMLLER